MKLTLVFRAAVCMGVGVSLLGSSLPVWAMENVTPDIETATLATGQKVYVQEIHTEPIVTIDTWVNTGSAQELPAGNPHADNGISHFLEHLVFKGTTHYSLAEIDKVLETGGADINAATSDDFTHFHITTTPEHLAEALNIHADMLLNATVNPPEFALERKVVQEEINRAWDNPQRKAYMALSKNLFGDHPYAMDTLGPKGYIQTVSREDILNYYHHWYRPKNFKTVIAGDVDSKTVIPMVQAAFAKAEEGRTFTEVDPKSFPVAPLTAGSSTVVADPNVSTIYLNLGFQAPSVEDRQENYALDIASMILGQGDSSRLNQRLHEEKQLFESVYAGNETQRQAGTFIVGGVVKPQNRDAAKQAMLDEIARFKAEGPTPEELQKAKNEVLKEFAFLNESTDGVAETIGYNVTVGKLTDYTEYVGSIQKVTAQEVKAAANKYLDFHKATLVELVPGKSAGDLAAQEKANIVLLADTPETMTVAAAPEKTQASLVTEVKLDNGAVLLLKPTPTQTVALSIFARGGKLAEGKPGVSDLASDVLLKGTMHRTQAQLKDEMERNGLSISAGAQDDYFNVGGTCMSDDTDKLLLLLQDVLSNPAFAQSEIDKERQFMLEDIKTSRDQAGSLMFEHLTETLYPDHPYGAVGSVLEKSLPGLTREDLESYYHWQMQPQNLVVSVVGNFNVDDMTVKLKTLIGALPEASVAGAPALPAVSALPKTETVRVQKPELAATWIGYGWLAPPISDRKDYITLKVINTLLGEGMSSRLFMDLRVKHGLAYFVSSMYPSRLKNSTFAMYLGTDPRNEQAVLAGFDREIARVKTDLVSPAELAQVKSKLAGSFALAHESNADQAMYLGLYQTLGAGYQFDEAYPKLVQDVTPGDIRRVANLVFDKPHIVTIVAPKALRTGADQ